MVSEVFVVFKSRKMPLELVVFLCWCLTITSTIGSDVLHGGTVSMSETTAVLTGVARLPCDLESPTSDDKVVLVIWYKDGAKSPIYSLDVRGRSLDQPTHWADERTLGGRSFFRVSEAHGSILDEDDDGHGTHLAVENVRETDAGSYRCRVDFKHSPTRNSVVNLTVIVPPRNVSILDEHGIRVRNSFIGPYTEGSTAHITCIALGGRPRPKVTWWHQGVLVDDSDETLSEHYVKNVLRLEHLERSHLHKMYTCQASNNNELAPVASNVSLDMYLNILDVRLVGENQPLSAGKPYVITCQAFGSRPPAHITWWKENALLDTSRETTSPGGNVTTSTLTLTPTVEDLGRLLACRTNNSHIVDSSKEDMWILNVHYGPIVLLKLGSNLNGSSIREGMDIYFECNIKANPWIYRIIWRHNGKVLHNSPNAGTIISNQTLVLQSVMRGVSGLYTCVASNSEGDTESNPFNLNIKYEPVCSPGQQRVYGAARLEEVHIACEVIANPPATLFRWSFNNSAVQSLEVGTVMSAPGGGRSVATYTPQAERDYGTLMCWGRNELGSQEIPCVFHIIPAGKPDPPRNCVLLNRTVNSLQVSCVGGFDGGLPQEFTLELYSATLLTGQTHRHLVSNMTSRRRPEFTVTGLEPGTGYRMSVYSSNGKGRSEEVVTLTVTTLKTTHQEHRKTTTDTTLLSTFPEVAPFLWVLVGIVGTLSLVGIVLLVVLRVRGMGCACCRSEDDDHQSSANSSQTDSGKALTVALTGVKAPAEVPADDAADNPDVIPHANDTVFPEHTLQTMEKQASGQNQGSFSINTTPEVTLYDCVQIYSSSPNKECSSYDATAVRWQQQVEWRSAEIAQAQEPQEVQVIRTIPTGVANSAQKQNAETQTQIPVRHKESAV